jgi:hypothetical protein
MKSGEIKERVRDKTQDVKRSVAPIGSKLLKRLLLVYFIGIIAITIYFVLDIWDEATRDQALLTVNRDFSFGNSNNQATIRQTVENQTSILNAVARQETNVLKVALLFGILGSSIHGIASHVTWIATNKWNIRWVFWYIARPIIAAALAILVYVVLRAGLITTVQPAVSLYGIAAVSALVGLFSSQATQKLRDMFDSIFGIVKKPAEKGEKFEQGKGTVTISPEPTKIKVNEESDITANLKKSDGNPAAANTEVTFDIDNTEIAEFKEGKNTAKTDEKGHTSAVTIIGKSKGLATISASSTLEEEEGEITGERQIEVSDK